jgi:hypothetical protein
VRVELCEEEGEEISENYSIDSSVNPHLLLQLLISVINTKLLETVLLEVLESINILSHGGASI